MFNKSALFAFLFAVIFAMQCASALPEPSITIVPSSISQDASFVMIVDPMTSQAPLRIAWSVFNPNMNGNYIMGQLPIHGGKGICYFSNTDGNATCGPSPLTGSNMLYLEAFVISPAPEYANTSKVVTLGSIEVKGTPALSNDGTNTVLLNYYLDKTQAETMKYTVYDENMQIINGLADKNLDYSVTPIPHFHANISLQEGIYFISTIATKGTEYGGKMDRIVVPKGEALSIDPCRTHYYFGESANITGSADYDSVKIAVVYPNGSIAKRKSIVVIDGKYSYRFTPELDWPEGTYNVTVATDDSSQTRRLAFSRLITVNPSIVRATVEKDSSFNGYVNIKNVGDERLSIHIEKDANLYAADVSVEKEELNSQETTILNISIDRVSSDVIGNVVIKDGIYGVKVPVAVKVEDDGEEGEQCPPCPECPDIATCEKTSFSVSPSVWSQDYVVDEEAKLTIRLTNKLNSTLSGFSYEFISDYSSDNSELSYAEMDPQIEDLEIDADDYKEVEFSFVPNQKGTYLGKIEISSGNSKSYVFVDLRVHENVSEGIEAERNNIEDVKDQLDSDIYDELVSYIDNAESDIYLGNYENAKCEIDKAVAVREVFSSYGSPSGDCPPCNCATGGSGGFDMVIIILIVVILVLGGVGAFLFMRSKAGNREEEYSESELEEEFDDDI
ncbi:MAG: hypothetical protein GXO64_01800 [Candidatus Micrarchaeota archaeon]|nr:hypothetical protein [Candidatus Micrarchaeota archaeon]